MEVGDLELVEAREVLSCCRTPDAASVCVGGVGSSRVFFIGYVWNFFAYMQRS
jgi:hypothetical protein